MLSFLVEYSHSYRSLLVLQSLQHQVCVRILKSQSFNTFGRHQHRLVRQFLPFPFYIFVGQMLCLSYEHEAVLKTMETNLDSPLVALAGLRLLRRLSYYHISVFIRLLRRAILVASLFHQAQDQSKLRKSKKHNHFSWSTMRCDWRPTSSLASLKMRKLFLLSGKRLRTYPLTNVWKW